MKTNYTIAGWLTLLAVFSSLNLPLSTAFAQGTAFTYQGRLNDNGGPATGIYDERFAIYDAVTNGNLIAGPLTNSAAGVTNGLFAVTLDFGSGVFTGPARWLQLDVRTNGDGSFTTLLPLQPIQPVPYAIMANSASNLLGTLPAAQLSGTLPATQLAGTLPLAQLPGTVLTNGASGVNITGTFAGNGAGISNVSGTLPWQSVAGTTQQATANTGYLLTNAAQTIVTLPTTANVGDVVRVSGSGAGGWSIAGSIMGATIPAGATWTPRESNRSWYSVASSADGIKLVSVVIGGQIYTSTDSGATWTPRDSNQNWIAVASSADGNKLVAVVNGGQIYTSTDSGVTWTPRESNRGWASVASSADGTKLVANANEDHIYTSTDSGATWTPRESIRYWRGVASSADGTKLVAGVAAGNQVYTSTDSGATWTPRDSNRNWAGVASSSDGTKLVAAVLGGQIYTSTDSGATWTPRDSNRNWISVASSTDGTKLAAVVYGGQIFTSTDSGVTWTPRESNRNWRFMASSADGTKLVAGVENGQIYTSMASLIGAQGTTATLQYIGNGQWQPLNESQIATGAIGSAQLASNSGIVPWQSVAGTTQQATVNTGYLLTNAVQTIVTLPATANVGDVVRVSGIGVGGWWVVANTNQWITGATGPAGVTWTPRDSNRNWVSVTSSADGSKLVAVVYSGGQIYTSTDSGVTWTPRESGRTWYSVASSADGTKLVAIVDGGQIYTSTDSGASWTVRGSYQTWLSVASSADGIKLVAVVNGGQIYTSTDSGVTWTPRDSNRNWVSVASSADGSKLVAVVYGGQIYTSTDSGVTWTPRESGRTWYSVASSADGTKLVTVVNGDHIYTSTDSGATWTPHESSRGWRGVASSADGAKLTAVVASGQIYTSTDSGVTWTPRDSNRSWLSLASSSDGTKLVAVVNGGQIYTSTASLVGAQGTTATLQYIGNGQWQPLNEAEIAVGSVGSAQLASNLVVSNLTVSGTLTAVRFVGDGSAITNLNASQITTGTLPLAQLPGVVVTNNQTGVSLSGTFSGNGAGLTNTTTAANYVFAYDTTAQMVGVLGTFQDVTFSANGQLNGWTHTAGTAAFTCGQSGLYLIEYTAEVYPFGGGVTASLIASLNGTEITGSQSSVSSITTVQAPLSKSFLVSVNSGDALKIQFTATGSSPAELFPGNGSGTTKPSISCTIIRIQ